MTHPQLRLKLEAAGFGLFIPVFFVASGLSFDLHGLFSSAGTLARVPLFLAALLVVRGVPAMLYLPSLGVARSAVAALLQATSLPFIVVACQIGLHLGVVSRTNAAALMAAGLMSVILFPPVALRALRRGRPERERPASATAAMPVLDAEARAFCQLQMSSGSATTSTSEGPG
jgi:Kef-type K+ transport system membrane component KefB